MLVKIESRMNYLLSSFIASEPFLYQLISCHFVDGVLCLFVAQYLLSIECDTAWLSLV